MPIDQDSFTIDGTTYTLFLDAIDVSDGTVTVEASMTRDGTSAIVDDMFWGMHVNGELEDTAERSAEGSVTMSGPGSAGDTIMVSMDTIQFDFHRAEVTGTAGGGNGPGGGDDGQVGAGLGLLALGAIYLYHRSKKR